VPTRESLPNDTRSRELNVEYPADVSIVKIQRALAGGHIPDLDCVVIASAYNPVLVEMKRPHQVIVATEYSKALSC